MNRIIYLLYYTYIPYIHTYIYIHIDLDIIKIFCRHYIDKHPLHGLQHRYWPLFKGLVLFAMTCTRPTKTRQISASNSQDLVVKRRGSQQINDLFGCDEFDAPSLKLTISPLGKWWLGNYFSFGARPIFKGERLVSRRVNHQQGCKSPIFPGSKLQGEHVRVPTNGSIQGGTQLISYKWSYNSYK